MNKYLEIIHFSFIFAPSKNKQIGKNKQIVKKTSNKRYEPITDFAHHMLCYQKKQDSE